jgi:hypothetical protein
MARNGTVGRGGRGKIDVVELSAKCLNVALAPTGGWRATLAINIQLEGPDGQRYRGAGSRLHVRVYPVRPAGGDKAHAAATNGKAVRKTAKVGSKRKAAAKR